METRILWSFSTRRWGHIDENCMKLLQSTMSKMDIEGMQGDMHLLACKRCIKGKQTRHLFPMDKGIRTTKILELIHFDVCGRIKSDVNWSHKVFSQFH